MLPVLGAAALVTTEEKTGRTLAALELATHLEAIRSRSLSTAFVLRP